MDRWIDQKTKREFDIVMSGEFRTLAMFLHWAKKCDLGTHFLKRPFRCFRCIASMVIKMPKLPQTSLTAPSHFQAPSHLRDLLTQGDSVSRGLLAVFSQSSICSINVVEFHIQHYVNWSNITIPQLLWGGEIFLIIFQYFNMYNPIF